MSDPDYVLERSKQKQYIVSVCSKLNYILSPQAPLISFLIRLLLGMLPKSRVIQAHKELNPEISVENHPCFY